ncbi:hypothetical protein P152DRAFT_383623, partial [Eremomyces bilateralis CBS 781.70]
YTHADIFRRYGVSKTRGYEYAKAETERRERNIPNRLETRGRPPKITDEDIQRMTDILESADCAEERAIDWDTLALEAGLDVSSRTIRRAMEKHGYFKCVACRKPYCNKQLAEMRLNRAKLWLDKYPTPDHWKYIRFSDEVHFGMGPQGKLVIIRKRGERYCPKCIQRAEERDDAEKLKVYAWAAVGYDFKSPLTFYEIPTNKNGKMTQDVYPKEILQMEVQEWVDRGDFFVLEEDQDSGHAPPRSRKKGNAVQQWKEQNGVHSYFNCAGSPDLAIIEDCWQPTKQYVRKYRHFNPEETRELAIEAWGELKQEWINKRVLSMPDRLRKVIEAGGQLIGY